jgi:5-formyltetrahydrofolate cyclo-ligase
MHSFAKASVLVGLMSLLSLTSGCVVAERDGHRDGYREGYYDHEHNRWYHEHSWRDCDEHDEHCR